jgi:flavin-dependent dehydrogenase
MIVGGGPAGISTWLHLQKHFSELAAYSLVIEKGVFPRDKLCAGGVGAWSADVLEHLEVKLEIPSLFVSDVEFKFGEDSYHFHQPNCFRVIQRRDFDHALAKTAVSRGLQLNEGEWFVDVTRDENRLIVESNKRTYRVQALIGADGALSVVRRKMMPPQKQHLARTVQIFAPVNPEYDTEFNKKKIVWDFTPIKKGLQGYVYHFPCLRNGAPSIAHGTGEVPIHANKPRSDLKKIFCRELGSRNINRAPISWSSHPIRWLAAEDIISQPNAILAGESAGIEPAFGGGIHIALSYGEVAAQAVADAFQSNDFSFHDYKQKVWSHFMGTYIQNCTQAARQIYSGRVNPLDVIRELFPEKGLPANLIPQMLAEVAKTLQRP